MRVNYFLLAIAFACIQFTGSAQFSVDWIRFVTEHSEGGSCVARDNADNIYAAGAGDYSMYLRKLDRFGNLQWTVSSTSYLGETPVNIFVDAAGNAVVAGYRYSTLHEGPYAVSLLVWKYSPGGNLIFKADIPGTYTYFNNSANRTKVSAAMDAAGNVYMSSGGIVNGQPYSGFNVVKILPNGNTAWIKTEPFGGRPFYVVSNIKLYGGALGLTGPLDYYAGNPGTWVLDTAGRSIWKNTALGSGSYDIAIDEKGNSYVTSLLSNVVGSNTGSDVTLYKFDKKGNQVWLKGYDFNGSEAATKIEIAPDKTLVLLGDGNQTNISLYVDWLTMKISTDGELLWSKRYDKTRFNDELPFSLAVDAGSNVYVGGIGGPFPGGSTLSDLQGVVLKYNKKGKMQWTALFDTLGFSGVDIAIASDTSVYALSSSSSAVAHILQYSGTDACSVPVNLSSSSITNTTAVLNWNAVPNAYLYHVAYKRSTSDTWLQLSTDDTNYTLQNLFAGTLYDYKIEAICNSGPTGFSAAKQFTTAGAGYCESRGLSSSREWIDLVLLGGISSVSGSDSGYADFTNLSTTLTAGNKYSITTSAETVYGLLHYQGWDIWIDYNHDGDFDDAGELAVQFKSNQIGWEINSFTVPASATPGPTVMRVSMKYKTYATPCEIFDRGEVEDYTVIINSPAPAVAAASAEHQKTAQQKTFLQAAPNPATNNITVNMQGFSGKISLAVYDINGKLIHISSTINASQYKINISQYKSGIYLLRATDEYGKSSSIKFVKQ